MRFMQCCLPGRANVSLISKKCAIAAASPCSGEASLRPWREPKHDPPSRMEVATRPVELSSEARQSWRQAVGGAARPAEASLGLASRAARRSLKGGCHQAERRACA